MSETDGELFFRFCGFCFLEVVEFLKSGEFVRLLFPVFKVGFFFDDDKVIQPESESGLSESLGFCEIVNSGEEEPEFFPIVKWLVFCEILLENLVPSGAPFDFSMLSGLRSKKQKNGPPGFFFNQMIYFIYDLI